MCRDQKFHSRLDLIGDRHHKPHFVTEIPSDTFMNTPFEVAFWPKRAEKQTEETRNKKEDKHVRGPKDRRQAIQSPVR